MHFFRLYHMMNANRVWNQTARPISPAAAIVHVPILAMSLDRQDQPSINAQANSTIDQSTQGAWYGNLQHLDHGRGLRLAACLEIAVRRTQDSSCLSARGG